MTVARVTYVTNSWLKNDCETVRVSERSMIFRPRLILPSTGRADAQKCGLRNPSWRHLRALSLRSNRKLLYYEFECVCSTVYVAIEDQSSYVQNSYDPKRGRKEVQKLSRKRRLRYSLCNWFRQLRLIYTSAGNDQCQSILFPWLDRLTFKVFTSTRRF